ncbi:vitamin B12-dependent ribonucleotide reductase, partial [Candidatus Uhrbacteria bacterium]|nr:vitamin B12-dependent ribonucleotide reductase [Candidatus Uhrbacteria bacterium]
LTTSLEKDQSKKVAAAAEVAKPRRRRLPDERRALTHKFAIGGHEGYLTVGLYDDGELGEIFITMSKEGSVISGLMDSFATAVSIALQYGVPVRTLVNKFVHMRFEPSGFTAHPSIKIAKSLVDYVFRWIALKFLPIEDQVALGINTPSLDDEGVKPELSSVLPPPQTSLFEKPTVAADEIREARNALAGLTQTFNNTADAPVCDTCGAIMIRNAACYKCLNCGGTSGCS